MKSQRGVFLNIQIMRSKAKSEKFFENKKIIQLFRFLYKTAKTQKLRSTWIWRLKFCRRYHNKPYGPDAFQTP
jgi:hypothetical protein